MSEQAPTRFVRIGFYVRPTRTLVTASVLPGVGGRCSPLWWGGWGLALGAGDLAAVAPERLPDRLMTALVTREDASPLTRETIVAWQRTWRPGGPQ